MGFVTDKELYAICNKAAYYFYVLEQFEKVDVIIIAKSSKSAEQVGSYKPISLLTIPSKVYERMILTRINHYKSTNQLIPDHQFGFRQKYGTQVEKKKPINLLLHSQILHISFIFYKFLPYSCFFLFLIFYSWWDLVNLNKKYGINHHYIYRKMPTFQSNRDSFFRIQTIAEYTKYRRPCNLMKHTYNQKSQNKQPNLRPIFLNSLSFIFNLFIIKFRNNLLKNFI